MLNFSSISADVDENHCHLPYDTESLHTLSSHTFEFLQEISSAASNILLTELFCELQQINFIIGYVINVNNFFSSFIYGAV